MSGWTDMLPHGPGFKHLTEVVEIEPGQSGRGVSSYGPHEPWCAAHFPGNPIVPGVFIIEALAQLAGIVAWSDHEAPVAGMLAQVDVRLWKTVSPPADLDLGVRVVKRFGALANCEVSATHRGDRVCSGTLVVSGGAP